MRAGILHAHAVVHSINKYGRCCRLEKLSSWSYSRHRAKPNLCVNSNVGQSHKELQEVDTNQKPAGLRIKD